MFAGGKLLQDLDLAFDLSKVSHLVAGIKQDEQ